MTNSGAAIFCVLGCLMLVAIATGGSLPVRRQSRQEKNGGMCTRNMACQWAVCPWSRDYMHLIPSSSFCLIIPNHCECPSSSKCTLTNNTKPGATLVRHEYRCLAQEKWNPQPQSPLVD